jgi:hypothetical protein
MLNRHESVIIEVLLNIQEMQKWFCGWSNLFLFGYLISFAWQFYFISYLSQFGGGHTKVDENWSGWLELGIDCGVFYVWMVWYGSLYSHPYLIEVR